MIRDARVLQADFVPQEVVHRDWAFSSFQERVHEYRQ